MDDVLRVRDTTLGSRRPSVPVRARTGKFSPPRALLSTTGYIRSRPVDPAVAAGQRIAHHQGQVSPRERLDPQSLSPPSQRLYYGLGGRERGDSIYIVSYDLVYKKVFRHSSAYYGRMP